MFADFKFFEDELSGFICEFFLASELCWQIFVKYKRPNFNEFYYRIEIIVDLVASICVLSDTDSLLRKIFMQRKKAFIDVRRGSLCRIKNSLFHLLIDGFQLILCNLEIYQAMMRLEKRKVHVTGNRYRKSYVEGARLCTKVACFKGVEMATIKPSYTAEKREKSPNTTSG
ncbi:hypothetical protein AVEN_197797-1 [Araneus ventricosus]|uniref:Uncharacterized protein n=1 Tax=Araneus ventricosus TaxID=182803 RepID=A0A4Y2HMU7_ARAVE|nr:hypothetical protein AVEN_197797-1 [Araneus ventricosus]